MKNNMEVLEFVAEQNHYLEGGTKEACLKVREFLKFIQCDGNDRIFTNSCVEPKEFISSVKTLMAFAFQKEDEIPKTWHCDNDCHRVNNILCPGECNIDKNSKNLCPYFIDEGSI